MEISATAGNHITQQNGGGRVFTGTDISCKFIFLSVVHYVLQLILEHDEIFWGVILVPLSSHFGILHL